MSDDLATVVEARLAAHTPATLPPLAALERRRRARDRRRRGGLVLAAVAAVGAVALLPALGRSVPRPDRPVAAPSPLGPDPGARERFVLVVSGPPAPQCATLPGVSLVGDRTSSATITGRRTAEAARACFAAVPGATAVLKPLAAQHGLATVWRGATVCDATTRAPCHRLDTAQASALFRQVSRRSPVPAGTAFCRALSTVYGVEFDGVEGEQVRMQVPARCGPLLDDGHRYLVDDAVRDAVVAAYRTPTGDALTADQARAVHGCGAGPGRAAPGYVGRTEQAVLASARPDAPVLVVARDGQCVTHRLAARVGQVDVVVDDGWVIWAQRV